MNNEESSSVGQHLHGVCQALDSILSTFCKAVNLSQSQEAGVVDTEG